MYDNIYAQYISGGELKSPWTAEGFGPGTAVPVQPSLTLSSNDRGTHIAKQTEVVGWEGVRVWNNGSGIWKPFSFFLGGCALGHAMMNASSFNASSTNM